MPQVGLWTLQQVNDGPYAYGYLAWQTVATSLLVRLKSSSVLVIKAGHLLLWKRDNTQKNFR